MELVDKGLELIDCDLRRLKKLNSLLSDLNNTFKIHNDCWKRQNIIPGVIASGPNYYVVKERVAIKSNCLSPSKGCRLWIVINRLNGDYYRCLLYLASEEKNYPKGTCLNIVNRQIMTMHS